MSRFKSVFLLLLAPLLLVLLTTSVLHPAAPALYRRLIPPNSGYSDLHVGYLLHLLAYGSVTAFLLSLAQDTPRRIQDAVILGLLAHGITTEILQRGIPGRSWDPFDMACNICSVLAVAGTFHLFPNLRPRRAGLVSSLKP